jgi:hypothetical protein
VIATILRRDSPTSRPFPSELAPIHPCPPFLSAFLNLSTRLRSLPNLVTSPVSPQLEPFLSYLGRKLLTRCRSLPIHSVGIPVTPSHASIMRSLTHSSTLCPLNSLATLPAFGSILTIHSIAHKPFHLSPQSSPLHSLATLTHFGSFLSARSLTHTI